MGFRFKRRRALLAVTVVMLGAAIVAVALFSGGGSGGGPATGAATLVPADALAYVHLSTDARRPAVKRALALSERFPDYPLAAGALDVRLATLWPGGTSASLVQDIRPWLGQEAAVALLDAGSSAQTPLVVLDVADRARALAFVDRAGATGGPSYRGVRLLQRSGIELAFVSHYLVIGRDASVRAAIDVADGAPSLADQSAYRSAAGHEPPGRVLDAYLSAVGVRRVLVGHGGLLGALGTLLYRPALTGVAISASAAAPGARILIHSALDPHLQSISGPSARPFTPSLTGQLAAGSTLALDVTGLARAAPRVLDAGAIGGVGGAIGPLFNRLGAALKAQGVDVAGTLSIFAGETSIAIAPAVAGHPPALVIVTRTPDMARARSTLAGLEVPLAQLFAGLSSSSGIESTFTNRSIDGVTAHQLPLEAGLELDYAVFRGLVVVSTSLGGIASVAAHAQTLAQSPDYRAALGANPKRVTSLLFLDFSQLLSLAEQTGLISSAHLQALHADLAKVRAVGLTSTSGEDDSTAELSLQIP